MNETHRNPDLRYSPGGLRLIGIRECPQFEVSAILDLAQEIAARETKYVVRKWNLPSERVWLEYSTDGHRIGHFISCDDDDSYATFTTAQAPLDIPSKVKLYEARTFVPQRFLLTRRTPFVDLRGAHSPATNHECSRVSFLLQLLADSQFFPCEPVDFFDGLEGTLIKWLQRFSGRICNAAVRRGTISNPFKLQAYPGGIGAGSGVLFPWEEEDER